MKDLNQIMAGIEQATIQCLQEAINEGFGRNIETRDLRIWLGRMEQRVKKVVIDNLKAQAQGEKDGKVLG